MNDLEKLLINAGSISKNIDELLRRSTYDKYDDLSGLDINYDDKEQSFLLEEIKIILDKLEVAKNRIDYLNKPIQDIGELRKNNRGRYELGGEEFSCGSSIEVVLYDEYYEKENWVRTRVEHNGKDYYLVGYRDIPMQGLKVRIR